MWTRSTTVATRQQLRAYVPQCVGLLWEFGLAGIPPRHCSALFGGLLLRMRVCVCVCVCVCSTGTRAEYAFEDRCYKTIFTRVRAAMFGSPVLARTSVASCSRRLRSAPLTASFAPYPRPNPRTMRAGGRLALVTYVNTPSLFDTSHVPPTPSPKLIESTSWLVATFAVVC